MLLLLTMILEPSNKLINEVISEVIKEEDAKGTIVNFYGSSRI